MSGWTFHFLLVTLHSQNEQFMVSDTIANSNGLCDDLCNSIILYSSSVSKEFDITYGTLWVIVMILIFVVILWYAILNYVSLYTKYKKTCKVLYWVSTAIIGCFIFFTIVDYLVWCRHYI